MDEAATPSTTGTLMALVALCRDAKQKAANAVAGLLHSAPTRPLADEGAWQDAQDSREPIGTAPILLAEHAKHGPCVVPLGLRRIPQVFDHHGLLEALHGQ